MDGRPAGRPGADLRRLIVSDPGDRTLVERVVFMAHAASPEPAAEWGRMARRLSATATLRGYFEGLLTLLMVAPTAPVDAIWVDAGERVRALRRPMEDWMRQTVLAGKPGLPPVGGTSGMAFVAMLLDTVEANLLGLRAHDAARRVSEMRCRLDRAFCGREANWLLESGFVAHVGHLVYASVLLHLRASGRLPAPRLRILNGPSSNPWLRARLDRHLTDARPAITAYVEMISARKRFVLADGRMATMSELVSEAATDWACGRPFLQLDAATKARGDAALAALGVPAGAAIVTLHVRESGYHPGSAAMMRLRDGRIEDYGKAVDALAARGHWVVRLGDTSMRPAPRHDRLVDYPFTAAKSDWMDAYLAARCRFHIGTSSGMSFVPLLFGRPVLFTNWVTLAHMVCAPSVVTLPKVLRGPDGEVVAPADYADRHREILEASDAALHGLRFDDNTPDELCDAAIFVDDAVDRGGGAAHFENGAFEEVQALFRASPLGIEPQIPPDLWLQRYPRPG